MRGEIMRFLVLCCLLLVGCSQRCQFIPGSLEGSHGSVEGVIEDVQISHETSGYGAVVLYFENGKIVKLRAGSRRPLVFQRGEVNLVTYDETGDIRTVEILADSLRK
jgi:hypothetical protein